MVPPMLGAKAENLPVAINVTTINKIPTEWGFAGSFTPMMLFIGTFISSLVSSVLLAGSHSVSKARGTATLSIPRQFLPTFWSASRFTPGFPPVSQGRGHATSSMQAKPG